MAGNYHVSLDSGLLGEERCVDLIVGLAMKDIGTGMTADTMRDTGTGMTADTMRDTGTGMTVGTTTVTDTMEAQMGMEDDDHVEIYQKVSVFCHCRRSVYDRRGYDGSAAAGIYEPDCG